jgi:hypothetical protein
MHAAKRYVMRHAFIFNAMSTSMCLKLCGTSFGETLHSDSAALQYWIQILGFSTITPYVSYSVSRV